MKKRNIMLSLSLAVLAASSISILLFTREQPHADLDRDYFKVEESETIDKVVLESRRGSVTLTFTNNRWRVNDKWDADAQMIKVFFATMRQIEPRRPVATAFQDSLKTLLADRGVHVTLLSGGVVRMSFRAGGNETKTEAWFEKDGDPKLYVMMIPGYRVYVSGVMELDEGGWRNKRIFDFNWRNFRSLTTAYPKEPAQGFTVEMKDRVFGIRGLADADTTRLNDYLDAVSLLFASRFLTPGDRRIDSLKTVQSAARMEIVDVANRTYDLEIFTPRKSDSEVYAKMGDQWVALDRKDVEPIVRRRDYFDANKPAGRVK